MSTVHLDIENVTEEGSAVDTYSVLDGMTVYTVTVGEDEFNAYDEEGNYLDNAELAETIIDQVIEFIEGGQ